MTCSACGHENRAEAKFCEECAGPLKRLCAGCGSELRPTAKFCDACGAALGGRGSRRAADEAEKGSAGASPSQRAPHAPAAPPELAPAVATASRPPPAPPRPRHRLAAVDWLLIGTLLPLCVFGVVMSVVHGVRGDFVRAPFMVSCANDGQSYPIVREVFSSPSREAGSVAVGDRVVRMEGDDLGGVSTEARRTQ